MSLRIKTSLFFITVLLIIFTSQILTRLFFEIPDYRKLENINDKKDMASVRAVIKSILKNLEITCIDYANWDDTIGFIQKHNDSYVKSNFPDSQLPDMNINGVVIYDNSMNIVFSKAQNINSSGTIDNPFAETDNQNTIARIFISPDSVQTNNYSISRTGMLIINKKPVIFSITSITESDSNPPSYGNILLWRYFDIALINDIIDSTQLSLNFFWITDRNKNPGNSHLNDLQEHKSKYSRNSDNRISMMINDYFDQTILNLVIQKTDHDFNDSIFSKNLLAGILTSLFAVLFLFWFINRNYLMTIKKFINHFDLIKETENLSNKLTFNRKDEISELADSVNRMMEYIEYQNSLLKESNSELQNLSNTDSLTQIPNRRHLDAVLKDKWNQAMQDKKPISFCISDVDYFKLYNDTYGHISGDMVLKEVAETLCSNLHLSTDFAARYGGEEFGIILYNTDRTSSCRVAENLIKSVENLKIKHRKSGCSSYLTISIGISTIIPEIDSDIELFREAADKELYKAKASGRNSYSHD